MTEYIGREQLKAAFENADPDVCASYPDGYSEWGFRRSEIDTVINSVPAADVAPVVYCKDCIYRNHITQFCHLHSQETADGMFWGQFPDDYFCADGTKREGGNTSVDLSE